VRQTSHPTPYSLPGCCRRSWSHCNTWVCQQTWQSHCRRSHTR
jgi:hypothetical protein